MKPLASLAAAALAALSLGLGTAGTVAAVDPTAQPGTLGASVSAVVIADENPTFHIINRGAVRMTFDVSVPDGWGVSPTSVELDPNAEGVINLTGEGDSGMATVYGRATVPAAGDSTAIRFGAIRVMQSRPFDLTRYLPGILAVLGLAAVAVLALRRVRPWELRVMRGGPPMV